MTTTKYHCHTASSIPGVAGIYAGVIVEVDDTTNAIVSVTPLQAAVNSAPSSIPLEAVPSLAPAEPTEIPAEPPNLPTESLDIPENKE